MKYGISAEEPKKMKVTYIVDKDNRKVICLIENTKRAFEDFINEQDSMLPFVLDGTRELFLKKANKKAKNFSVSRLINKLFHFFSTMLT